MSAFHESGMTMHFFDRKEIEELFSKFSELLIDEMIVTHENGSFSSSDYQIFFKK
tara:strand:- start:2361 stop:2525 length:165 start_codon:yes stop_codon:yes gene_type:complete